MAAASSALLLLVGYRKAGRNVAMPAGDHGLTRDHCSEAHAVPDMPAAGRQQMPANGPDGASASFLSGPSLLSAADAGGLGQQGTEVAVVLRHRPRLQSLGALHPPPQERRHRLRIASACICFLPQKSSRYHFEALILTQATRQMLAARPCTKRSLQDPCALRNSMQQHETAAARKNGTPAWRTGCATWRRGPRRSLPARRASSRRAGSTACRPAASSRPTPGPALSTSAGGRRAHRVLAKTCTKWEVGCSMTSDNERDASA